MKYILITIAVVFLVGCGELTIHDGASDGNIDAVKKHLAAGADVNARNDGGFTPLHYAAMDNRKEVVELLIDKGADVNAKDYMSLLTPLHSAALHGHKEVVELLIDKGADVNGSDNWGSTPLDAALPSTPRHIKANSGNESAEIADLLRKHGGKRGEELKAEEK
jgi:ankyrin repeat protein